MASVFFYAQAIDNKSKDDIFFAKNSNELKICEDINFRQKVPLIMSSIVEKSNNFIDKPSGLEVYVKFNKCCKADILISFNTNQKDEIGRDSNNIIVLEDVDFDVNNESSNDEVVKKYMLEAYIKDFLAKTNRGNFRGDFYNIGAVLDKVKQKKKKNFVFWLGGSFLVLFILVFFF